jgi:hypothetical protein
MATHGDKHRWFGLLLCSTVYLSCGPFSSFAFRLRISVRTAAIVIEAASCEVVQTVDCVQSAVQKQHVLALADQCKVHESLSAQVDLTT